ncbi:MAG TPA: hypothetical protein VFW07_04875 [Parafilimonas sp.]|nr:hypothetical protein [Parafilimonas sp.]
MKPSLVSSAVFFAFILLAAPVFAQTDSTASNITSPVSGYGKVQFMRKTGFEGSGAGFTVFIDSNYVCKLNEARYSVQRVPVGTHSFSVQFGGKKSKTGAEKITIDIEEGKTYYIQVLYQTGFFVNNILCQEVTASSARLMLPKLKEDKGCAEDNSYISASAN